MDPKIIPAQTARASLNDPAVRSKEADRLTERTAAALVPLVMNRLAAGMADLASSDGSVHRVKKDGDKYVAFLGGDVQVDPALYNAVNRSGCDAVKARVKAALETAGYEVRELSFEPVHRTMSSNGPHEMRVNARVAF